MTKARVYVLGLLIFCSACTTPSLRYKKEISQKIAQGEFAVAADTIAEKRIKHYGKQDRALAYLDEAVLRHDAEETFASDSLLAQAQDRIEELYTVSISKSVGRLLINDVTLPYNVAPYERAMTYFYRAMNFLTQQDLQNAAVEVRRAVQFLDSLRGSKAHGYNDDPFVQYFASLIFESVGQLSDARICRTNALNGYNQLGGLLNVSAPKFSLPPNYAQLGEVIIFHYNGLLPIKYNQTLQLAWNDAFVYLSAARETAGEELSPQVENAIRAGFVGDAVTVSFAGLEEQPYEILSAFAETADGRRIALQKVADLAAAQQADLQERLPAMLARSVARAVTRQVLAKTAHQLADSSSKKGEGWGDLAELFVHVFGNAMEKADTRQWFTLPAQIFMTRIFVRPGMQDIRLHFRDRFGNIVGEHTFQNVRVRRGGRVFLHYRTAQ